jgi:glycosyltransferase involved in cell wall biosynthesis
MKHVLYGSIAARLAGVPVMVNAFTGLGYVFISNNVRTMVLRSAVSNLLRWALAHPNSRVIFQNQEDLDQLIRARIVQRDKSVIIRGAGVDVKKFVPISQENPEPVVILAARMLWDKGIGEFVNAARSLKALGVEARFVLVGMLDEVNPAHIPRKDLLAWEKEGVIEWWGHREDMPQVFSSALIAVLPSYREGLPKVLLEAAACGRPIIATDVPGCREIVKHNYTGILVPPKDSGALAHAMRTLLGDARLRARLGARAREMVVNEFSAEQVARDTISEYMALLPENLASGFRVGAWHEARFGDGI